MRKPWLEGPNLCMNPAIRAMIKGVRKAALNPIQRRTPITCLTLGNPPGP